MKRKLLVILSCFPSCCFPELWYPSPVVLTSPFKAAKLCPFSWPNLKNTRVHKKLPVPKVSSFALGQLSFENKSLYNVKRRGAAHISVDHKLQLRSRNVYKNAILNSAFRKNHVHPVIWDMKLRQQFNLKIFLSFLSLKWQSQVYIVGCHICTAKWDHFFTLCRSEIIRYSFVCTLILVAIWLI